jgi:hypothetical protein
LTRLSRVDAAGCTPLALPAVNPAKIGQFSI